MFYYVIAYVTPTLIVSLTLGIKQDVYTNYDNIASHQYYASSIYCWLNLSNTNELFIVFLLPLVVICLAFLILCLMSFKERKQSTFKQTDLGLVYHSLLSCLILLPFNCVITIFLVKFLLDQVDSSSLLALSTFIRDDSDSIFVCRIIMLLSLEMCACLVPLFKNKIIK